MSAASSGGREVLMADQLTAASAIGKRGAAAVLLAVTVPLLAVYLPTATWRLPYHIDPVTNALTGWYMGTQGAVFMPEHSVLTDPAYFGVVAWLVESPRGVVSQYPPGAAALSAPLYALSRSDLTTVRVAASNRPELGAVPIPLPPLWPATLAAVLVTSLASGILALTLQPHVGRRWAIATGLAFGLATGAWAVASNMLWTHGPGMLFIAIALYLCSRDRLGLAGVAFGAAILTRPHLAVVAAAVGLAIGFSRRTVSPIARIGASSGAGLGALVLYNWSVFGHPSIRGGYHTGFVENLVDPDIVAYAANVWGALFDLSNGLFIWAPFLLLLIAAVPAVWRRVPPWALGAALGGVVYLLIQLKANRFSGGDGHFAYRYPLETLMASAPLLALAAREWVWERPISRGLLVLTILAAGVGQGFGAITGFIP
jgi:hypothetical protein